jgi:hypothetical protein
MSKPFSPDWWRRFQERVNQDPELAVTGKWFSTPFSITRGSERVVLRVENGRIADIVHAPRFDVRTSFGLRGPETLWQNFLLPTPPPLYHDIFAMIMRVPDLVLEGDTLVAMQNARALHRMMNVMREVR